MSNEVSRTRNFGAKLYICLVGLALMFAVEVLGGISLGDYIHTMWIGLFAMILPYEGILYIVSFLAPTCSLLPHFAHAFLVLLLILIIKKYVLLKHKTVGVAITLIILFTFWEIVAYAMYGVATINKVLGYASAVAILFWIIYDKSVSDYKKHLKIFILGSFVLCALALLNTIINYSGSWISDFLSGGMRLGGTANSEFNETDVSLNANALAYYSVTAIACYLCSFDGAKKRGLGKFSELLVIAVVAFVGMLTVSRSWLLITAVILLLFYFSRMRQSLFNAKNILAIFAMVILVVWFVNSPFMEMFNARFEDDSADTAGGRTELFEQYFDIFFSNTRFMLFGTGVTNYTSVTQTATSMHNGAQQILVCLGLPMAIMFIIALAVPIFKAKRQKKIPLQYWLPAVAIIGFTQTIQFLNPNTYMVAYIMIVYALKLSFSSADSFGHQIDIEKGENDGNNKKSIEWNQKVNRW